MMHKRRVFTVETVETLDYLVMQLSKHSWCMCQGFRWSGLLILNDSTGPDGAQEYSIVREKDKMEIESITVSWCSTEELTGYLKRCAENIDSHEFEYGVVTNTIETPEQHTAHDGCGACQ